VGQAALGWFGGASSAFAMIYELLAPPSPLSRTPGQNPTKVRLPCVQRVHRWWSRNTGGAMEEQGLERSRTPAKDQNASPGTRQSVLVWEKPTGYHSMMLAM